MVRMDLVRPLSAVVVVSIMVFSTVGISFLDEDSVRVDIIDSPRYTSDLYRALFEYPSGVGLDFVGTCYYTDDYFMDSASIYDPSLATASLCVAMSAFTSNNNHGFSHGYQNVEDLLLNLDFTDFTVNDDFKVKPREDTIGLVAANKVIRDDGVKHTLIVMAVRGGGYYSEWVENFLMGSGEDSYGNHEGFHDATVRSIDFLESYISENDISGNIKLWITGFSRGAAVSNMVAGYLDTDIADGASVLGGDVILEHDDLYAYTFGTPMGVCTDGHEYRPDPRSGTYDNIWNIVNRNDPVPKVAMSAMGFCRYGNDVFLPDTSDGGDYDVKVAKMLGYYESMDSRINLNTYSIDDFVAYRLDIGGLLSGEDMIRIDKARSDCTLGDVLDSLVTRVVVGIGGREGYIDLMQDDLCELVSDIYTYSSEYKVMMLLNVMLNGMMELESDGQPYYLSMGLKLLSGDRAGLTEDLEQLLSWAFSNTRIIPDKDGDGLPDPDLIQQRSEKYAEILASFTFLAVDGLLADPELIDDIISLAMNADCLVLGHYPELYYSWLMSLDPIYDTYMKL